MSVNQCGTPAGTIHNDPGICHYHRSPPDFPGRDLNLLNAANARIKEFPYYANKDRETCAFTPLDDIKNNPDQPRIYLGEALGPTLGWHAQSIDARVDDTVLWFRPTNAEIFGFGALQKELANRVIDLGLGAALIPFVCLAQWFSGDSCDADDAFDLATQINPITLFEGTFPGLGAIRSLDLVGVWHFINVGALDHRYNDVRGMLYEQAGPTYPGVIDVAIMAGADVVGLSLNAHNSQGRALYGRFDRLERTTGQWQAHALGHIEFSPVDNLARNGWDAYVANPTTALPLSWPLHAIGDAAAPQHVTGTTGWGHRPFEDAVDNKRSLLLPARFDASFVTFRDRVLRTGVALTPEAMADIPFAALVRARVETDDLGFEDELRTMEDRTAQRVDVIQREFEERKEKTMFIMGAGNLRYGDIVDVIDAAKGAGVEKVGIVTEGMRKAAGASAGTK